MRIAYFSTNYIRQVMVLTRYYNCNSSSKGLRNYKPLVALSLNLNVG